MLAAFLETFLLLAFGFGSLSENAFWFLRSHGGAYWNIFDGKSDNQSSSDSLSSESEDDSEDEDCVLAEIGISSSEEEEESTEEEEMIKSTENFNVNTTIVYTRSGRRATRIQI